MTATAWNATGTDEAAEYSRENPSSRVLAVTDGVIGYWRELGAGESVAAALSEFRAFYRDATGDPVQSWELYVGGECEDSGT